MRRTACSRSASSLSLALVGLTWSPKSTGSASRGQLACGNNVAALLVHNRKIIGWGLNVMTQHRSLHAETAAIQVYLKQKNVNKLPNGCKLYSSLQPCKMCAGFIAHVGVNAHVMYALADQNLTTCLISSTDSNGNKAVIYSGSWLKEPLDELRTAVNRRILMDSGTTTAMFDRDVDHEYEWAMGQEPLKFGQEEQEELDKLPSSGRSYKQRQRFTHLTWAKKIKEKREERGELGMMFAAFANRLGVVTTHATKSGEDKLYSNTAIAVANQCLDLLWVATQMGMSTRYGLKIVNNLISRAGV